MSKIILSAFADEYNPDFDKQLEVLQKSDISMLELRFADKINVSDFTDEKVSEIKNKLDASGITLSALGSPIGKITLDDDMDKHIETAKKTFETAEILGAKNIRFFSFYPHKDMDIAESENEVFEKVGRLVETAEKFDVCLCHENEAKIYGESPEKCLKLMKEFGGRIKCVFDMGNFVLDGFKPYPDAFDLLKEHIEYFHIKDSLYAGAIVPPGKGEASIPEILKAYKEYADRDFIITLEPHLQTFDGLNALVGKAFDNPYKFNTPEEAFLVAVDEIKNIIGSC